MFDYLRVSPDDYGDKRNADDADRIRRRERAGVAG
jgi:hypothetical protein